MKKRILVVHGHPMKDSYNAAVAAAYAEGAAGTGAELRHLHVHDLQFDPVLWQGYRAIQPLEPDLLKAQADIVWAEHLVFVFPIWWGTPPAKFKGFVDRAFHPSWAFKFIGNSPFQKKLLAGRSARVIATMDSPPWYHSWLIGEPGFRMMKHSILKFCGISPVRCTALGSVRFSTPAKRERWLKQVRALGTKQA